MCPVHGPENPAIAAAAAQGCIVVVFMAAAGDQTAGIRHLFASAPPRLFTSVLCCTQCLPH
jgi:hypothetical protein